MSDNSISALVERVTVLGGLEGLRTMIRLGQQKIQDLEAKLGPGFTTTPSEVSRVVEQAPTEATPTKKRKSLSAAHKKKIADSTKKRWEGKKAGQSPVRDLTEEGLGRKLGDDELPDPPEHTQSVKEMRSGVPLPGE